MALLHRLYEEAAELFTCVAVCEALSGGSDGHRRVVSWRYGSGVGKYGDGFGSVHSPMQIHEPFPVPRRQTSQEFHATRPLVLLGDHPGRNRAVALDRA